MVQTPVVESQLLFGSLGSMLNAIRLVVFGSGGFALDALMACRRVHVAPQTEPSVSAVEVTVNVINGVAVGVGVGVGVGVPEKVVAVLRPAPGVGAVGARLRVIVARDCNVKLEPSRIADVHNSATARAM
jgi:hypothetical protein